MSWLSMFLRRDSVKLILKLIGKVLAIIAGRVAKGLQDIAMEEVKKAEASGKNGLPKYKNT